MRSMLYGLLCLGLMPTAGAATADEMARLDAVYPPGSVVICHQELPGQLQFRGTILTRTADQMKAWGTLAWFTHGYATPGLTLTFTVTQRNSKSGYYSRVDPASMIVLMPATGPEGEKIVLDGMRRRLPADEELLPSARQK